MNITQKLNEVGQSIWYDNIQRKLLKNGEMAGMISRGEIRGVTSNPSIFMNAIAKSNDYDETIVPLAQAGHSAEEIYDRLTVEDIQSVADLFLPLYKETNGGDGYLSLEVSPYLANDTERTIADAKRLWSAVNRPNLMIKIPATKAGLPAITATIEDGINVNVTLIFSRERYAEVMDAFASGLEQRTAQGLPIDRIASVASFFVSRVDTKIDAHLQKIVSADGAQAELAGRLLGKAAIANACLAYADFKAFTAAPRWQKLAAAGARPQRPLWASTSTKNPAYRDVMYVEELIAPQTVNTVPPQTLVALLDHLVVQPGSLEENIPEAEKIFDGLEKLGISMAEATQQLEVEGVKAFSDSYRELLETVEARRQIVTVSS